MEGAQPSRTFDATGGEVAAAPTDDEALAPIRPGELNGTSPLDLLRATVSKEVHRPPIHLPIPERAGVVVEYDTNIENDLLTAWRKRSTYDDLRDGVDPLKFACILLSNKAVSFSINGRRVTSDGHPLTFASQEVWEMLSPPAGSTLEAVRHMFGVDAHVIIAGEEVLRAAGYGDSIQQEDTDPTVAPLRR